MTLLRHAPTPSLFTPEQQQLVEGIQVRLLVPDELPRCAALLEPHHYLGSLKPVGERLHYAVTAPTATGSACGSSAPPRAACARALNGAAGPRNNVAADWQARYSHPVLAVETFVDPAQFSGTRYPALRGRILTLPPTPADGLPLLPWREERAGERRVMGV